MSVQTDKASDFFFLEEEETFILAEKKREISTAQKLTLERKSKLKIK